ncbi:hypothetical protein [Guptibacillus spartinae]|uniref:hypothetical protein n=1 Tax=Guptibacillus spartinae TaxID=3025679 RepID=UPI00235F84F9|nr:hypothetical protein [Pseudalkalibacillus spartinae]
MKCEEYRNLIIGSTIEKLPKRKAEALSTHLRTCEICRTYAKNAGLTEKGLQEVYSVYKPLRKSKKSIMTISAAVAMCFIVLTGTLWNIPAVKASVQSALNIVVADKFENMMEISEVDVIKAVEKNRNGEEITTYINGQKERTENENGDYTISDGDAIASYDQEKNIFLIEKNANPGIAVEEAIFSEMDPSKIQSIGREEFFGRTVEKYLISESEESDQYLEFWFDQKTDLLVREIEINGEERHEESEIIELNFSEEVPESKFSMEQPDGAKVIDER